MSVLPHDQITRNKELQPANATRDARRINKELAPGFGKQQPSLPCVSKKKKNRKKNKNKGRKRANYRSLAGFRTIFNVRTPKSGAKSTQLS
jgi:hypothetical protein